jgi:hypothetical protein
MQGRAATLHVIRTIRDTGMALFDNITSIKKEFYSLLAPVVRFVIVLALTASLCPTLPEILTERLVSIYDWAGQSGNKAWLEFFGVNTILTITFAIGLIVLIELISFFIRLVALATPLHLAIVPSRMVLCAATHPLSEIWSRHPEISSTDQLGEFIDAECQRVRSHQPAFGFHNV